MKVTVSPSGPMAQTPGVLEMTEVMPFPWVPTVATNNPNSTGDDGMFVTAGGVGFGRLEILRSHCSKPSSWNLPGIRPRRSMCQW